MAKYRFEQIAINCTQKRIPTEDDNAGYIGLEHLDSGSLAVTRWGSQVPLKGEKLVMHKGDVLLGKRNAYLRRAAVCPHDGVFSAHGMVLQPKEEVIDKSFFPLFIASNYFFDEAIRISVGSLSPTVNWKDLKNVVFDLPSIDEQKRLASVLWAINDTIESYKKLIFATDDLVKSQFMEQFNLVRAESNGWSIVPLNSVVIKPLSGEWGQEDTDGTGVKVLRTTNFTDSGRIDYSEVVRRSIELKKVEAKALRDGDILIEKSGGSDTKPVGRVIFYQETSENYLFNNFTALLRPNTQKLNSRFLFTFLFVTYWNGGTKPYENKTTGIHNLKLEDFLDKTMIPIPPIEDQEVFAEFVRQSDKSKLLLGKTLDFSS
jgi:type I restriction enzyme S subunit